MYQLYYRSSTSSESEFSLLSPGDSREQLNGHLEGHFEHQCDKCDYTSRTEGRLKQHIQRFHGNDDFNDGRLQISLRTNFVLNLLFIRLLIRSDCCVACIHPHLQHQPAYLVNGKLYAHGNFISIERTTHTIMKCALSIRYIHLYTCIDLVGITPETISG